MQITRKAVISLINRKLAKDTDEVLKVSRSARMKIDVGDFYLLDWRRPSSTMRIFSSAENCRRVARRISFTTLFAGSFTSPDFCLIFAP